MSIKRKFAASSAWVALGNSSDNLIQFVVFAVLARLLPVSAIGLVTYAMVAIDILRVIASAGTAEAVIRRPDWDELLAATAFWVNVAIALILILISVPIVIFLMSGKYSTWEISAIALLFPVLLIDASRAVHVAKLRRDFNFRSIATRSVMSGLVSGLIAICIAYLGGGIMALAAQRLIYSIMTTLQTWRAARWTPLRAFSVTEFYVLVPFTVKVLGARILDIGTLRLPDFMIGSLLGSVALGYYKVGARALDALFQLVIKPVQFATLPALSAAAKSKNLDTAFLRMTTFFAAVICPAMLGSSVLSTDLIRWLFSDRYQAAAPVMEILALSALPACLSFFVGPALVVRDKAGSMLILSLSQLALTAVAVSLLAHYGLRGAAAAVVIAQYLWLPGCTYLISKHFGFQPFTLLKAVGRPFICSILMMCTLRVGLLFIGSLDAVSRTLLTVIAGAVLYPVFLRLLFPSVMTVFATELSGLGSRITGRVPWLKRS